MFISICSSQDVDAYGLMGCVHIQGKNSTTHKWGNPSLIRKVMKNIAINKQNMGLTNQVVNCILALGPKHEKKNLMNFKHFFKNNIEKHMLMPMFDNGDPELAKTTYP